MARRIPILGGIISLSIILIVGLAVSLRRQGDGAAELYLDVALPLQTSGGIQAPGGLQSLAAREPGRIQSLDYDPMRTVELQTRTVTGSCALLGAHRLIYMDRHYASCEAHESIQKWRFSRCGNSNDFKMITTCASHGNDIGNTPTVHYTGCQDGRWGHAEYLDRSPVECPTSEVLTYFHLTPSGCRNDRFRIEYHCRKADIEVPTARNSRCRELRTHNMEYMDQQRPSCPANTVMTKFQLHDSGCSGNDMRFKTWCAEVHEPWYNYGVADQQHYKEKEDEEWAEYSKELAKYQGLSFKKSPSGTRIKDKYEHHYASYLHWKAKWDAVTDEREAIKYIRMYNRWKDIPNQQRKAQGYLDSYNNHHNRYLEAQGAAPEPPVVTYPAGTFAGPDQPDKKDPGYWAGMWTLPTHGDMEGQREINTGKPKAMTKKCGDDCTENTKQLLERVKTHMGDIMPTDPDWASAPKALVKDVESDEAKLDRAFATESYDPLGNADYKIGVPLENQLRLQDHTGCLPGDKDCLKEMGVWPGESPEQPPQAMIHDHDSAVDTLARARKHLGDQLPEDPEWTDFPSRLVEDRGSSAARMRDAANTKVFDPTENADIAIDVGPGDMLERNDFAKNMRDSVRCDLGDYECIQRLAQEAAERQAGVEGAADELENPTPWDENGNVVGSPGAEEEEVEFKRKIAGDALINPTPWAEDEFDKEEGAEESQERETTD